MAIALLIVLGAYLAACYAYGAYVLVRLWRTKTVTRPTSKLDPADLARLARVQLLDQDQAKPAPAEEGDTRVAA